MPAVVQRRFGWASLGKGGALAYGRYARVRACSWRPRFTERWRRSPTNDGETRRRRVAARGSVGEKGAGLAAGLTTRVCARAPGVPGSQHGDGEGRRRRRVSGGGATATANNTARRRAEIGIGSSALQWKAPRLDGRQEERGREKGGLRRRSPSGAGKRQASQGGVDAVAAHCRWPGAGPPPGLASCSPLPCLARD